MTGHSPDNLLARSDSSHGCTGHVLLARNTEAEEVIPAVGRMATRKDLDLSRVLSDAGIR